MPISNPSYFPPNRSNGSIVGITAGRSFTGARSFLGGSGAGNNSAVNDLIVIGNLAVDAGLADANDAGTIVIGNNGLGALTNAVPPNAGTDGPITIVGYNNWPLIDQKIGSVVNIGANIGGNSTPGNANVVNSVHIGNDILKNNRSLSTNSTYLSGHNVIVGHGAAKGVATTQNGGGCAVQTSVVIGADACNTLGFDGPIPGSQFANNVVIGYQAGQGMAAGQNKSSQLNVIIGTGAGNGGATSINNNVLIGSGITTGDNNNNTVIGDGIIGINKSNQVLIGSTINASNGGARSVIIGDHAASTELLGDDGFLLETQDAGTAKRTLISGNFVRGNVVIGQCTPAQRNGIITGANLLMLVNGTIAGVNPSGGGYFYVAAGALHWVGSAGTDTPLAPA
jgi:hypothetical protein